MGVIFSTEDVETENESFFDAKYIYKISDLFQGPKSEIKSILVTQIILQNSVRIHATKFSKEL